MVPRRLVASDDDMSIAPLSTAGAHEELATLPVGEIGVESDRRRIAPQNTGIDVLPRRDRPSSRLFRATCSAHRMAAPLSDPGVDDLRFVRMADDHGPDVG